MSRAAAHSQSDNLSEAGASAREPGGFSGEQAQPLSPDDRALFESMMAKPLPPGAHMGYFTRGEKIRRLMWGVVQATVFRWSPRRWDGWRAWLLRCFGAKIGKVKLLRSSVRVEVPWNIEIGDGAQLGDRVYLYSLGPITIGAHTVISQFCHLCAGTHDHERTDFPLIRTPIHIGDRCWIATECFVGPGVRINDGVVLGARASVVKDLPPWSVCVGSPAKPIGPRRLFDVTTGQRLDQS